MVDPHFISISISKTISISKPISFYLSIYLSIHDLSRNYQHLKQSFVEILDYREILADKVGMYSPFWRHIRSATISATGSPWEGGPRRSWRRNRWRAVTAVTWKRTRALCWRSTRDRSSNAIYAIHATWTCPVFFRQDEVFVSSFMMFFNIWANFLYIFIF